MIQRLAHSVRNNQQTRTVVLSVKYNGTAEAQDDILLLIAEAWYHDIKKFGGDPMTCMAKIHEVMKDWPIDKRHS